MKTFEELTELGLATFLSWETIKMITPVEIPGKIQPVVVAGIAYGVSKIPVKGVITAMAIGAGAAILSRKYGDVQEPVQISLGNFKLPKFSRKKTPVITRSGARLPTL